MDIDEREDERLAAGERELLEVLDSQRRPPPSPLDPVERAREAGRREEELATELEQAKAERYAAVQELRAAGWSHQQVADALGISHGRAQQLAKGRSRSGRAKKQSDGE